MCTYNQTSNEWKFKDLVSGKVTRSTLLLILLLLSSVYEPIWHSTPLHRITITWNCDQRQSKFNLTYFWESLYSWFIDHARSKYITSFRRVLPTHYIWCIAYCSTMNCNGDGKENFMSSSFPIFSIYPLLVLATDSLS